MRNDIYIIPTNEARTNTGVGLGFPATYSIVERKHDMRALWCKSHEKYLYKGNLQDLLFAIWNYARLFTTKDETMTNIVFDDNQDAHDFYFYLFSEDITHEDKSN